MNPISLVLIVHDHQPIGNFDSVFRQAYDDAYGPFLAFIERRPEFRLALHTSGPLLQWLALHERDYLARLRARVEAGQVELWGGAFFEPILPAIPERDRRGQIRAMADWLELELGQRPRGGWLAERVWEPALPSSLAPAGVEYTAVDDAHFVAAGLEREQLWGYFLTEDQGRKMAVFPIHRELRYLVPFAEPEATVELLRRVAAGGPGRIAVLGDDGEKFGVWPGTKQRCYDEGWLERFAAALAAQPWIEVRTPAEAVAHHAPLGLAYLPTASYHEMQEWALPPEAQARYHRAGERLTGEFGEAALDLLRGGHWRGFQMRYPESNRLHKRMLRVSQRVWENPREDDGQWRETRMQLWRSQCNCPYWHGVFGGLYLPHLRSAIYRHLIAAEAALPIPDLPEVEDLDLDGFDDALLETPEWAAWVSARGGRLWAFDDRVALCNYGDTLARRPEYYHQKLGGAAVGGGEGRSIHEAILLKEPGLAELATAYDAHGRDSFLAAWTDERGRIEWAEERFALEAERGRVTARAPERDGLALEARYVAHPTGLQVTLALRSAAARRGRFAVTLNLGLHVPRADDRWVALDGQRADPPHWGAVARHPGVARASFVDAWAKRALTIRASEPVLLERSPIETVSLSEAGAERVFQGVETHWSLDADLAAGVERVLEFTLIPTDAPGGES